MGRARPGWFRQRGTGVRRLDFALALSGALRAGLSLVPALELVQRDLPGPVAEEIGLLLQEYQVGGIELAEAFARLGRRMPLEETQMLVSLVKISLATGASLVEGLELTAVTIRKRLDFQARLKTLTAAGRFEAAGMASTPALALGFLYFLDTSMLHLLVTTREGWTALAVALALECLGFLCINKISKVDY